MCLNLLKKKQKLGGQNFVKTYEVDCLTQKEQIQLLIANNT